MIPRGELVGVEFFSEDAVFRFALLVSLTFVLIDASDVSAQLLQVPPQTPSAAASAKKQLSDEEFEQRIGELFDDVLPTLEKTRERIDQHRDLPDRTLRPFKEDKRSNQAKINKLLDDVILILDVSGAADSRERVRELQERIKTNHRNIAEYKRKRLSVPAEKKLSRLERANPFVVSKESYDEMISEAKKDIVEAEQELEQVKANFAFELKAIGLDIDREGVESLLSSVSGDDITSMAIVFDNIKHLTTQLQGLTEDTDEALDVAKRYYGMYVVLVQVMDRMQERFIDDVVHVHIPKLKEYDKKAQENIQQAELLIKKDAGDLAILKSNIASNRVTQQTAKLYVDYLRDHAALIKKENEATKKNLNTALNTYMTVKLSSDVATLMKTGRKNFEALMNLNLPPMQNFRNEEIRREFERMTQELMTNR